MPCIEGVAFCFVMVFILGVVDKCLEMELAVLVAFNEETQRRGYFLDSISHFPIFDQTFEACDAVFRWRERNHLRRC